MFVLEDLEKALETKNAASKKEKVISGISIDSRTLKEGDLFVAISGPKFDGHDFLQEAKNRGAAAYVVEAAFLEKVKKTVSENLFVVEDSTVALGELARYYRKQRNVKSAGITGSCGKTTTKQITSLLLQRQYNVLSTDGNFNNQFGLPLTLFRLKDEHEVVVAEVGASRQGDIDYLCGILEPEVGLITSIYPAHLEGFGSLEKIYETKLEIGHAVKAKGGTLIVNGDNEELVRRAKALKVDLLTFGRNRMNHFSITKLDMMGGKVDFVVNHKYHFSIWTHALFNVDNFLAGIVMANKLGVSFSTLEGDLREFHPVAGRFECHSLSQGITVIHDAYNANPGSMTHSLESFSAWQDLGIRKIAILGNMMELGKESGRFHREVARELKRLNISVLLTVGDLAREIAEEAREVAACKDIYSFHSNDEVISFLFSFVRPGDSIFLKGSRAMKLDEILSAFKARQVRDSVAVPSF